MFTLRRKLKNQKGAMDKIVVTLLLVIVGAAAVVGLNEWMGTQLSTLKGKVKTQIESSTTDAGKKTETTTDKK